jgi:hypothetical protein
MMNEKPSRSKFVTSNDTPAAVAGRISASLDQADAALRADPLALGAPTMRTFSLNSREFADAVCAAPERPWIPNGALPREPKSRDLDVIVEPRARKRGE